MFDRMSSKIKYFFTSKSRIGQLEDEVADMKKRIFKEESKTAMFGLSNLMSRYYFDNFYGGDDVKPLEEDFFDNLEYLQEKIDLLAKHMGVKFIMVPEADEHLSLKSIKVGKTKKK